MVSINYMRRRFQGFIDFQKIFQPQPIFVVYEWKFESKLKCQGGSHCIIIFDNIRQDFRSLPTEQRSFGAAIRRKINLSTYLLL
jgi:hypothetical protein